MTTYKELLELCAQRQLGILGKIKTLEVFKDVGLPLNDAFALTENNVTIEHLDQLMNRLNDKYGAVTVMGCKIALMKKAKEGNLELPSILSSYPGNR